MGLSGTVQVSVPEGPLPSFSGDPYPAPGHAVLLSCPWNGAGMVVLEAVSK